MTEEHQRLSHMLDAAAEHARLQDLDFNYEMLEIAPIRVRVELKPCCVHDCIVSFVAEGQERNEVLLSIQSKLNKTRDALGRFLGVVR